MSWVDGRTAEQRDVSTRTRPTAAAPGSRPQRPIAATRRDRGYYSAPSISPDGSDVWLVYNAFTTPFRDSAEGPDNDRQLVGVVLHADAAGRASARSREVHRGATGDARARRRTTWPPSSSATTSTRRRRATTATACGTTCATRADCPEVDEYRQELHEEAVDTGQRTAEPEEPRGAEAAARGGQRAGGRGRGTRRAGGVPGHVRQLGHLRRVDRRSVHAVATS